MPFKTLSCWNPRFMSTAHLHARVFRSRGFEDGIDSVVEARHELLQTIGATTAARLESRHLARQRERSQLTLLQAQAQAAQESLRSGIPLACLIELPCCVWLHCLS
jgi:hypothetical protein